MKVLITRPRTQSASFAASLIEAGFEPVFFPVIETRPVEDNVALDRAIAKLNCYDWVVFTSANGVDVFFDRLLKTIQPTETDALFSTIKVAVIGPKTAQALQKHGIKPDFMPTEYFAEAILPGLGDLRGRWVLLPRAEIARKELPDAISEAGGVAHEIHIYQTVPALLDQDGLAALKSGVDVITFTSSSTVENFVELSRQAGLDPLNLPGHPVIACIGPITQKTAQDFGYVDLLVAEEYTSEGLVKLLHSLVKREDGNV